MKHFNPCPYINISEIMSFYQKKTGRKMYGCCPRTLNPLWPRPIVTTRVPLWWY
uniref:Uncharacterized protein n=1 Tax=Anguilla anguilla TaxID=7936 RepID=A0A0E9S8H2_ANGAN